MEKLDLSLHNQVSQEVRDLMAPYLLTDEQLSRMRDIMRHEIEAGLSADEATRKTSSLQMEITHVYNLCDGTEEGDYLGLDLGGTNFRVLYVHVGPGGKLERNVCRFYNCTEEHLTGTAEVLFDHIASSIARFVREENVPSATPERPLPLGFSFSFPMSQESLQSGLLLTWTKTFRNTSGVGEDAVQLLQKAIKKRHEVNVEVLAILNDTTGTLACGSFDDHECAVSMIIGTGSNACYLESVERVPKWREPRAPTLIVPNANANANGSSNQKQKQSVDANALELEREERAMRRAFYDGERQVVVDTEWGAFGDNGSLDFLKTQLDLDIDRRSNHVHSFTFEKLFSGLYLGEVVRALLAALVERGLLLAGVDLPAGADGRREPPPGLAKPFAFETRNVSRLELVSIAMQTLHAAHLEGYQAGARVRAQAGGSPEAHLVGVLQAAGVRDEQMAAVSAADVDVMRYVAHVVSVRAAQLIACALATIVERVRRPYIAVAVDGSLFKLHPRLSELTAHFVAQFAPDCLVKFVPADDGSGRGAALVAAVIDRRRREFRAQLV